MALPVIIDDLSMTLSEASLAISIFSLIAAMFGAVFGAIGDRFGAARIAVIGLLIAGVASAAGAYSQSPVLLLVTRVIEGIGFFLASTSIPALMLGLSNPADRQKAMGLWGAFLPAGTAFMIILGGPLISAIGWRGLWFISTALLFAAVLAIRMYSRRPSPSRSSVERFSFFGTYKILRYPGPLLMALIFVAYSAQFLAVTAFIPLILVEESGWQLASAGAAGGLVVAANVVGNIYAGVVLDKGMDRQTVLIAGAFGMVIGASLLLAAPCTVLIKILGGVIFTAAGGLIPGALFAGTSTHAPKASDISTLNGLLLQGAAIGQLIGPPVAVVFAQWAGGWSGALWFTVPVAIVGGVLSIMLGTLEKQKSNAK